MSYSIINLSDFKELVTSPEHVTGPIKIVELYTEWYNRQIDRATKGPYVFFSTGLITNLDVFCKELHTCDDIYFDTPSYEDFINKLSLGTSFVRNIFEDFCKA